MIDLLLIPTLILILIAIANSLLGVFVLWKKLAYFISRNDSLKNSGGEVLQYTADSIINWIAQKERHRINIKNRIPLFIRYFTCEGKDGKIIFYDDIYGEDKVIRDKYFASK